MLFTQFNMDDALEVRYEEGVEDGMERGLEQGRRQGLTQGLEQGLEQGRTQGERRLLIHLVCGKLQKGEKPDDAVLFGKLREIEGNVGRNECKMRIVRNG